MIVRPRPGSAPPLLFDLGDELVVTSPGPGSATGQPFNEMELRDVILDAELGLVDGEQEDRCGLFFRQTGEERYVACTINGAGELALGLVDGGPPLVIAEARLDGETRFQSGVGRTNRLTIVACGPVAAVMVNGMAVTGALLDRRYLTGRAGALLVHTSPKPQARLAVRWAQARAIIG